MTCFLFYLDNIPQLYLDNFFEVAYEIEKIFTEWGVNMETHQNQYYNLTKNIFNNLQIGAIT